MLDKIKGIVRLDSRMDWLERKIEEQHKELELLHKEIYSMGSDIKGLQKGIKGMSAEFSRTVQLLSANLGQFQRLNEGLNAEMQDFKVVKSQLQGKLSEKVASELQEIFTPSIERLKTDVRQYNDLKSQLGEIAASITTLSREITKFTAISSKIKESDFDLTRHARQLERMDREKLQLLKRIDDLQRMVGRERRLRSSISIGNQ